MKWDISVAEWNPHAQQKNQFVTAVSQEVDFEVQASCKTNLMKRAIKYKQSSENLMKIGQRIRSLQKFKVLHYFMKH